MSSPAHPETVGRYRILEEIGRGAMGRVYRAHDPHTDRTVALKVLGLDADLSPEDLAQAHARFLREARAAGRLAHPGIVSVYDADIDATTGSPFLAMELVVGRSLAELLGERGVLDWKEAVEIAALVADALDHAHERGVVHRDLKPANVLLADSGGVKVSDFGVAMLLDDSSTLTGTLRGTPAYMAPEQIRGETVDSRADLYSLGALLYEMLTGEPPFRADTLVAVAHQAVHDDPRPPSFANPDLPLELERFVQRTMAKRPEDRFGRGSEMAAALRALAAPAAPQPIAEAATVAVPRVVVAAPPPAPPPAPAPQPRPRGGRAALAAAGFAAAVVVAFFWLAGRSETPAAPETSPPIARAALPESDLEIPEGAPSTGDAPAAEADSAPVEAAEAVPAAMAVDSPAGGPASVTSRATANAPPPTERPTAATPARRAKAQAPEPKPQGAPSAAETAAEVAPPAEPTPDARIEIHFVNRIRDGSLTVSIDGQPVWATPLESPKNPLRRIGGEELIGFIPITAGRHEIEVHVVNASERIDASERETIEISAGETRILRVDLQALRSKLKLKWGT